MDKHNPRARRLGEQISASWGIAAARRQGRAHRQRDDHGCQRPRAIYATARVVLPGPSAKDGFPDPKVQAWIESAAGFLRNALSGSLMIRYSPLLSFELDTRSSTACVLPADRLGPTNPKRMRRAPWRRKPQPRRASATAPAPRTMTVTWVDERRSFARRADDAGRRPRILLFRQARGPELRKAPSRASSACSMPARPDIPDLSIHWHRDCCPYLPSAKPPVRRALLTPTKPTA